MDEMNGPPVDDEAPDLQPPLEAPGSGTGQGLDARGVPIRYRILVTISVDDHLFVDWGGAPLDVAEALMARAATYAGRQLTGLVVLQMMHDQAMRQAEQQRLTKLGIIRPGAGGRLV